MVVPTGLPPAMLEAVVADIWRHANATPGDPATWYQPDIIRPRPGMVEMYHYQSMWDVRQHPAVYGIFRDLHGTDALWVSIDRVALKPPVRPDQPGYDQPGFIHWDTDISLYPDIPFRLQGVLALEDATADMGGFQCVPSIYRDQQRFLDERSKAGPVSRAPDIGGHPIVRVPLAAGDLVIWKTTLLHGNGRNSAQRPRLAQYITMNPLSPAGEQREMERRSRILSWSACAPPDGDAFPGDPRRIEEQRGEPASLSPLGRRLLGLDEWP
jgi:Phytanoyl-CoA dioxygenase (PhyH)